MAWTTLFINAISASRIYPIYLLESADLGPGRNPAGEGLKLSSAPVTGYKCILTPEGARFSYGQLQPREWSYTFSEFSIGLLQQGYGIDAPSPLRNLDSRGATTRGQVVQLRLGFPGWAVADFETIALGVVQDIAMEHGRWSIRVRSIVSSLVGRWDMTEGAQALFRDCGTASRITTLTAGYTAGDPTISVTDSAVAAKDNDAGTAYLIRITPDTGDPFLLMASGVSVAPDGFSGLSVTGILGTTAATASAGNNVEVLAFVNEHPFEVIRKVLVSTGTLNSNGAHDTLPAEWGLDIDQVLLDHDDIDNGIANHEPTGVASPVWHVWADAEQEDALGWVQEVLAPMGGFLCERMGLLTIRAACGHFAVKPTPLYTWDLDDSDLVDVETISTFDPSQTVEYAQVRFFDPAGGATDLGATEGETISTRPALSTKRIDLSYLEDDRTDWRELIRDGIGPYYTRIGQPVSIVCRGWRLAQAAPGDHMQIATRTEYLSGRGIDTGADMSDGAAILITSVEPDWFGSTTRLRGVFLTADPDEGG